VDVERYLTRIGLDAPAVPDLAALERLQQAHLTSIPFENLYVFYRRGVRTDVDWSTNKIVDEGRGGWCFELNGAFAALLEAIGYKVTRLGAVVLLEGDDGHASHLTLRVDLDRPYLVDVGFGDTFIKPLPLDGSGPHDGGTGLYQFESADGSMTLIEVRPDGTTQRVYRFTLTPLKMASFDEQSIRLQTDLTLKWTKSRFATRILDYGPDRVTLLEDRLRIRRNGIWKDHPIPPEQWAQALRKWFDLTLP
jgi:N-hydroxyarylamine O-acetyltransferase